MDDPPHSDELVDKILASFVQWMSKDDGPAPTLQMGPVYRRTEKMAPSCEMSTFECSHCSETLESWNSAWVPSYQLVIGPSIKPVQD
jgi:hypothetical protein